MPLRGKVDDPGWHKRLEEIRPSYHDFAPPAAVLVVSVHLRKSSLCFQRNARPHDADAVDGRRTDPATK